MRRVYRIACLLSLRWICWLPSLPSESQTSTCPSDESTRFRQTCESWSILETTVCTIHICNDMSPSLKRSQQSLLPVLEIFEVFIVNLFWIFFFMILSIFLVKSLYKGATSSFVGMAFESSLIFGVYSQMKQALQVCPGKFIGSDNAPSLCCRGRRYYQQINSFVLIA